MRLATLVQRNGIWTLPQGDHERRPARIRTQLEIAGCIASWYRPMTSRDADERLTALHESASCRGRDRDGHGREAAVSCTRPASRHDEAGRCELFDWSAERDADVERHLTFVLGRPRCGISRRRTLQRAGRGGLGTGGAVCRGPVQHGADVAARHGVAQHRANARQYLHARPRRVGLD